MLNRNFFRPVFAGAILLSTVNTVAVAQQDNNDTCAQSPGASVLNALSDTAWLSIQDDDSSSEIVMPAYSLNEEALRFTESYLAANSSMLGKIKEKNPGYFVVMDTIFHRYGIPVEIKYLAIIESQLKTKIASRAGAVGAWQLMPVTARHFALKVSARNDERTNFYKSTVAAAKYLNYLYDMFGDWLLVVAAYNGGPGSVFKAIRKSGSRDFWKMQAFLPNETRNHVKKFISTHYYYEQKASIATATREEADNYAARMNAYTAE